MIIEHQGNSDDRFLSVDTCKQVYNTIKGYSSGEGRLMLGVTSLWNSSIRWSRNFVNNSTDRRVTRVDVYRDIPSKKFPGRASTNQIDNVSLKGAVEAAERSMIGFVSVEEMEIEDSENEKEFVKGNVWSRRTLDIPIEERGNISRLISQKSSEAGVLSAGFVELHGAELIRIDHNGKVDSESMTQAQCSITVRDPKQYGSGWAGASSYDWGNINAESIANIAFEKCLASKSPVRIEPGRYTVIMEPQAVSDCITSLLQSFDRRNAEDQRRGPFFLGSDGALGLYRSKLGLQVIDPRITISHDPLDPLLGTLHTRSKKRVWIENGILVSLDLEDPLVHSRLAIDENAEARRGFYVSGGETTIQDMISSTERGLLMTRFHKMFVLNESNLLSTGVTRDGLWLIENGVITKAVNNLRCTDSPLFMLNQVDQLGVPVPVFKPSHSSFALLTPCVVPPIKSRDFSFTSLVDAV